MREILTQQLELIWSFATRYALDGLDDEAALWRPSDHVVTVHRTDAGWVADSPDEDRLPLPDATIGWLLWHIEFWWSNAADAAEGLATRLPGEVLWSGSTAGVVAAHDRWVPILGSHDLDRPVAGLMPQPRPFSFVAAWVNVELTKNLAEINQRRIARANRPR